MPPGNRSATVSWMAQVLTDAPLPVVEVDWGNRLQASGRALLERLARARGPRGALVVVRVRLAGTDLVAVANDPVLRSFEWLVLSCDHRCQGERLGRLRELCAWTLERLVHRYDTLVEELGLPGTLSSELHGVGRLSMDPWELAKVVDHALELELQPPPLDREAAARTLRRRLALDSFRHLTPKAQVLLLGVLSGREGDARESLGDELPTALADLASALVLIDGRPSLWAGVLEEPDARNALAEARLPWEEPAERWGGIVQLARAWVRLAVNEGNEPLLTAIEPLWSLVAQGRSDAAQDQVEQLAERAAGATSLVQGMYWDLVAALRLGQGRLDEAERAALDSLRRKESSQAEPQLRAYTLGMYGVILSGLRRRDEAITRYQECDALLVEWDADAPVRPTYLDMLVELLRQAGRWDEAVAASRESLRVREVAGAPLHERAEALHKLGQLLQDADRLAEAEWPYRDSLHLREQMSDSAVPRAQTLVALTALLFRLGRVEDALTMVDRLETVLAGSEQLDAIRAGLQQVRSFLAEGPGLAQAPPTDLQPSTDQGG